MQKCDGRSIPDAALEVLRERAVAMHQAGNAQLAIAAALGVHKNTVHHWLRACFIRPVLEGIGSGRGEHA
jgi:hypothetical protein